MRDFTATGSPLFIFDYVKLSVGAAAVSTFVEKEPDRLSDAAGLGHPGSAVRLRGEQIRSGS